MAKQWQKITTDLENYEDYLSAASVSFKCHSTAMVG